MRDLSPAMTTWRNLHLAYGTVRAELEARLSERAGCSLVEHDLMAWLVADTDCPLRMLDLSTRLGVTPSGLTRIADRLTGRDWLERTQPSTNRREVHITLTAQGKEAFNTAGKVYRRTLDELFDGRLSEREVASLGRIARKLLPD